MSDPVINAAITDSDVIITGYIDRTDHIISTWSKRAFKVHYTITNENISTH